MYIMYTMYMSEYTIAAFRKNIRQALNEADSGEIVTIKRYGQEYQVRPVRDLRPAKKADEKPADSNGPALCEHGRENRECPNFACPHNPNVKV
jgi:hypothetical protein